MNKLVYLTGAPATGKTSLCEAIKQTRSDVMIFSYAELLRKYLAKMQGVTASHSDMRRDSSVLITSEIIDAVDKILLEKCRYFIKNSHIIIDSHAVTKERYGLRVTPFTLELIEKLNVDSIVCLYADPEIIKRRITHEAEGRIMPTDYEISLHIDLQAALALQYSLAIKRPLHLINTAADQMQLVSELLRMTKIGND